MDEFGINASRKNSFAYLQDTTGGGSTNYENDAIDFGYESISYETDEYSKDWEIIEPERDGGYYKYVINENLSVTVSEITKDTVIRINPETGEIEITGGKGVIISGDHPDEKINIYSSDVSLINITSGSSSLYVEDSVINTIKGDCNDIELINTKISELYANSVCNSKIRLENSEADLISAANGNDTIDIINSKVFSINGGSGNDNITLDKNSEVNRIIGEKGDDTINILSSKVTDYIETNDGMDFINIFNSNVKYIDTGKDNDKIYINKSSVTKEIDVGSGENYTQILNSDVNIVNGGADTDTFLVRDSNIDVLKGNAGDDTIVVNSSSKKTVNIFGGKGNDAINIMGQTTGEIDGGKGSDIIFADTKKMKIKSDKKDYINDETKTEFLPYTKFNDEEIETAENITSQRLSSYSEDLTPEQQTQAITIDFLKETLNNMTDSFNRQELEDGKIADGYNIIKELLDCGVNKKDIQKAIDEQEQMIADLTSALKGTSKESFEDCFKRWLGIDYNEEAIMEYYETSQIYSVAVSGLQNLEIFKNQISNAKNMQEVFDYYVEFYGSKERAREEINKTNWTATSVDSSMLSFEITEDYKIKIISKNIKNGNKEFIKNLEDYSNIYTSTTNIRDIDDLFEGYKNDFLTTFKETMGISLEELQGKYATQQVNALGSQTSFQKLIDRYCLEQNTFASRLGSTMQMGGMGLIVIGGIVSFVFPPAGMALMSAGKYTAISGMFADNILELGDNLTSENGLTEEEASELLKESVKEILLLYTGAKINKVSSAAHSWAAEAAKEKISSLTQQEALGWLAEIGSDATLGIITEFMITGELDFSGEALSQLLGVITGIAGAKIKNYQMEKFSTASKMIYEGDSYKAVEYLRDEGFSDKQIFNNLKNYEIEKIESSYKNNGDYNKVIKMIDESDIFKLASDKNYTTAKSEILESIKSKEIQNCMNKFDATGNVQNVITYAKSLNIFTDADIEKLRTNLDTNSIIQKLSKEYKLNYQKYKTIDFSSAQGKVIAKDIQMLYKAKTEGLDINSLMVPKYDNINSASKSVQIGDVFEVEGSKHIYIKTADGNCKELSISKEKYCELFPPVERFASVQQQSGDCYLIAPLNSMMSNPKTRYNLLSCLTENPDGSISAKLPQGKEEINLKKGQTLESLGYETKNMLKGAQGMQLLECLYKVDLSYNKILNLENENYFILKNYNDYYDSEKESLKQLGIKSPDEIPVYVVDKINSITKEINAKYNLNLSENDICQLFDQDFLFEVIKPDRNERLLSLIQDDAYKKLGSADVIKEIYDNYIDNNQLLKQFNTEAYWYQNNNDKIANYANLSDSEKAALAETAGGNGGYSYDVFKAFGLDNTKGYNDPFHKNIDDIINDPSKWDKYLICGGTLEENCPNPNLVEKHAYSVEFTKNELGETMVIVTNPWSFGSYKPKSVTLTVEEFKKCFKLIYIAEIN